MIAHCTRLIRVVACVAVIAPTQPAAAQTDTMTATATTTTTRPLCWRPRPAPLCRAYIPTEFAYEHPVASTWTQTGPFQEDDFNRRFTMAAGLMRNRGPSTALGGLLAFTTDHPEGLGLLRGEGRYRRWIGSRTGVDVGLGLAQQWVYSRDGVEDVRAVGFTAGVGLDFQFIGVDARIDRLRGGGRSRNGAFVGVHAGSEAAAAASSVAALVTLIAFIAWIGSS